MPAPSSLTARQAIGVQSAKGTPSTHYVVGVMRQSYIYPEFDTAEPISEHYGGTNARATVQKSASDRTGYLVAAGGRQRMKPDFLGMLLRGAGFGVATTGTTVKTHAFTLADRVNAAWLTIMEQMGEGAGVWEHKALDCRVNNITLAASREELALTYTARGLSEAVSLGTETVVVEPVTSIVPSTGSVSLLIGGVAVFSRIYGSELTISNPLIEDDVALHTSARDDIAPQGLTISGRLSGVDFDKDVYKKINWGGTSGTAPSTSVPLAVLSYTFESKAVIPAESVPYAVTISVPVAQLHLPYQPTAEDNNLIRADIGWSMVDSVATPITITLVNKKVAYTPTGA